ncbi:MAG: hypothetical protein KGY39_08150 [Anaerolineales bacterium]|nr:hypothetical protein [Anaerolineales bacterium]
MRYTEFEWWLSRWSDNLTECQVYIDHEGKPTNLEIFYQCESDVYQRWLETTPCLKSRNEDSHTCPGYYLFLANTAPREKQVKVKLPSPEVSIEITHCESHQEDSVCSEIPHLFIQAEEPLPNEHIFQIQGQLNGTPFVCQGSTCDVPLRPTTERGVSLSFWADSTYGDSSTHYQGRVRLIEKSLAENEDQLTYQVNLISDQYENESVSSCSKAWHAFPALGTPPGWLSNPRTEEGLATDEPLTYLAGKLISYGLADASVCPGEGLLSNGYASACGLSETRTIVTSWQNKYDPYIIRAAQEVGIPSQLLKNVFIQESQLWPENMEGETSEHGLGHLTEWGADTTLLWNNHFFAEFCPFVLSERTCKLGYGNLDEEEKDLLQGSLLTEVSLTGQELTEEDHFNETYDHILLFAESLLGQCKQTKQIIYNYSEKQPGDVSSYEDLWRFTLVNYHAGSRCLGEAMEQVVSEEKPLSWYFVSSALDVNYPNAVEYITKVTQERETHP